MKYGIYQSLKLLYFIICTKLFVSFNARVIKGYPRLICKKNIQFGFAFTAGVDFRAESLYGGEITIGDRCKLNDYVHLGAKYSISIGDECLFGSRVTIIDHQHGDYKSSLCSNPLESPDMRILTGAPIAIEDRVWLGEGVVIMPGVTVGAGSIVGANSVVTKDIPCASIAVGIPAEVKKIYDAKKGTWANV